MLALFRHGFFYALLYGVVNPRFFPRNRTSNCRARQRHLALVVVTIGVDIDLEVPFAGFIVWYFPKKEVFNIMRFLQSARNCLLWVGIVDLFASAFTVPKTALPWYHGRVPASLIEKPTSAVQRLASIDPTTESTLSLDEEPSESELLSLPDHSTAAVNGILRETESVLRAMHKFSLTGDTSVSLEDAKEAGRAHEKVYANNYVDLGKITVCGFDFDYTLVTYTEELLELIYDMALKRLVVDKQYPVEMLQSAGLKFDPYFSIRGLAVDTRTGWICHLSYTHKVAVAWEGREKVSTGRIYKEYRGKRGMRPSERRRRLKPLNDIFSMSECCLIADTVQFFKDRQIPYHAQNIVTDVLAAIRETHISGDFHRLVAANPGNSIFESRRGCWLYQ